MPDPRMKATGSAPVVKQGHTTDGSFGSDPSKQRKTPREVRNLGPK